MRRSDYHDGRHVTRRPRQTQVSSIHHRHSTSAYQSRTLHNHQDHRDRLFDVIHRNLVYADGLKCIPGTVSATRAMSIVNIETVGRVIKLVTSFADSPDQLR